METLSSLLAICAGNSLVTGEFPSRRPVMRSFDVFFDLCLNEQLSKQSWDWWFEMPSHSLWCHCNDIPLAVACVTLASMLSARLWDFWILCFDNFFVGSLKKLLYKQSGWLFCKANDAYVTIVRWRVNVEYVWWVFLSLLFLCVDTFYRSAVLLNCVEFI